MIVRFLPDWFPGTGFKRVARRSSYLANRMRTWPYGKVQELYVSIALDTRECSEIRIRLAGNLETVWPQTYLTSLGCRKQL